jgi:hypothetical protein
MSRESEVPVYLSLQRNSFLESRAHSIVDCQQRAGESGAPVTYGVRLGLNF